MITTVHIHTSKLFFLLIHRFPKYILINFQELYQNLYKEGLIIAQPELDYEFSKQYAHITITGQSNSPKRLQEELQQELKNLKEDGIDEVIFERIKKKIYGNYVMEFNDVADIARMFMGDYFKGVNSFDYLELHEQVTKKYAEEILKECFNENKMILSVVEKGTKK